MNNKSNTSKGPKLLHYWTIISFLLAVISLLLTIIFRDNPLLYDIFRGFVLVFAPLFIITLLDRLYIVKHLEALIKGQFKVGMSYEKIRKQGYNDLHLKFDFNKIFNDVEDGGVLKILDTYIPRVLEFLDSLESALNRDVTIKILVINPDSDVAKFRAEEIKTKCPYPIFKEEIKFYVKRIISKIPREKVKNLQLRYYSDLPCVPMYILKNTRKPSKLYYSFFLSEASAFCPHFEIIEKPDGLLPAFEKYFDEKWERNAGNDVYRNQ